MAIDPVSPNIFDRVSHFLTRTFYGKDMKKHQKTLDSLHKEESSGKWSDFADKAKDPKFVKAVAKDPRSNKKLKLHAERLHMLHTGSSAGSVAGSKGSTYKIVKLSDGGIGCTCRDWKYVGSVTPGYECRHIKEYKRQK